MNPRSRADRGIGEGGLPEVIVGREQGQRADRATRLVSRTHPEAIRDVFTGMVRVDMVKGSKRAPRRFKGEMEASVKSHSISRAPLNEVLLRSQSRKLTEVRTAPAKVEP